MAVPLLCLFLQHGTRDQGDVIFNSSLGVIFGVKKYADALWKVVEKKGIKVNLKRQLVTIRPREREAVFDVLDPEASDEQETFQVHTHTHTYVCTLCSLCSHTQLSHYSDMCKPNHVQISFSAVHLQCISHWYCIRSRLDYTL